MNIAKLKCLLNPRDEPEMNENEPYLINLNWRPKRMYEIESKSRVSSGSIKIERFISSRGPRKVRASRVNAKCLEHNYMSQIIKSSLKTIKIS